MLFENKPTVGQLKEKGNLYFQNGKFRDAKHCYSDAIKLDTTIPALYTNRASCYLKLKSPSKALNDASAAIELDPSWVRGHQRKAEALIALKEYDAADDALLTAIDAFAGNEDLLKIRNFCRHEKYAETVKPEYIPAPSAKSFMKLLKKVDVSSTRALSSDQLRQAVYNNRTSRLAAELECKGDIHGAISGFMEAAEKGCTVSMCALGRIYFHGQGIAPNHKLGVEWFQRCINSADGFDVAASCAKGELGQAYRHGIFVQQDFGTAEKYLNEGANGGDPTSMNNLGSLLAKSGREIEAVHWYTLGSENDYPLSKINLALFYRDGRGGLNIDLEKAKKLLEGADDDPRASELLADIVERMGSDRHEQLKHIKAALNIQRTKGGERNETLINLAKQYFLLQKDCDLLLNPREILTFIGDENLRIVEGISCHLGIESLQRLLCVFRRPLSEYEELAVAALEKAMQKGLSSAAGSLLGDFYAGKHMDTASLAAYLNAMDLGSGEAGVFAANILMREGPLYNLKVACRVLACAHKLGNKEATRLLEKIRQDISFTGQFLPTEDTRLLSEGKLLKRRQAALDAIPNISEDEKAALHDYIRANMSAAEVSVSPRVLSTNAIETAEKIGVLTAYLGTHPHSYSGYVLLQGLISFERVYSDPANAVQHLARAYLFDEKAVVVAHFEDAATGNLVPEASVQAAFEKAKEMIVKEPDNIIWAVLVYFGAIRNNVFDVSSLNRAIHASELGIASNPQLLPRLLTLRASARCFQQNFEAAFEDFSRVLKLLREVPQFSLIPDSDVDGNLLEPPAAFKDIMILETEMNLGRVELLLESKRCESAIGRIQRFIDGVPHDTHYFVEAHYELFTCYMGQRLYDTTLLSSLCSRADAAMTERLPFQQPLTTASFPKMAQAKSILDNLCLLEKKNPTDMKITSRGSVIGDESRLNCWGCGTHESSQTKLKLCAACNIAKYCTAECQKHHWKAHKRQCKELQAQNSR